MCGYNCFFFNSYMLLVVEDVVVSIRIELLDMEVWIYLWLREGEG